MTAPALIATYRLQFHHDFPFAAAAEIVPYLAALGVSHVYASPVSAAVPGSMHGYDVVDPNRISPELGGETGFEALCEALSAHGMGLILDIVPNHMAASSHNPYWMETLEFGHHAPAAAMFDIYWETGKLLLPVLGDPLETVLAAGQLSLRADWEAGRLIVAYADHAFPLEPASVAQLLARAARAEPSLEPAASVWAALASGNVGRPAIAAARSALHEAGVSARQAVEEELAGADMSALLESQHWRLAWWRTAADELNYRRFFNITDLVGVRVEDPDIFEIVHQLPLSLVRRGQVHGLRIDHVDGLVDPAGYLERLRAAVGPDIPIFVEKILEHGEVLPLWPVEGTTGYERLNDINGLFVDKAGYAAMEAELRARNLLSGTTGERVIAAKRQIIETSLAAELDLLVRLAREGLAADMARGDVTDAALRRGVIALVVHCPVYRSYATEHGFGAADMAVWTDIRTAVEASEDPLTLAAARLLLDRLEAPEVETDRVFRRRSQQITGPVMAKGYEDTELYRTPILLSVNEVGGNLDHPSRTREEVHRLFEARARAGTRDLISLATHDTKRGPETRARLNVLSLSPDLWIEFLREVEPLCEPLRAAGEGRGGPDILDERMIHQTLYATWPISQSRVAGYLRKALREAKRNSNWETPDHPYESAVEAFAGKLVEGSEGEDYRQVLQRLVCRLAPTARIFSLAQATLHLTLPGVPDIYQGTEFRDFSLVDPDNRRPVDFGRRVAALSGEGPREDVEKVTLMRHLLRLRHELGCFSRATYRPLEMESSPWRWFGFELRGDRDGLAIVVPTRVPPGDLAPEVHLTRSLDPGYTDRSGKDVATDTLTLDRELPLLVAVCRA
ncbi:malto-oligosyltrehalose synthase [Ancylobacter pratisalsi]|uniref:Malto-oligosyltrehalose synthase n=1 Tax=Ancylobacter pratisalsi TaxID=1745854 RepID=A0A6P1YKC6_9HYPH|nr:malto-oligosyltrehalose synthase [Ancylobacter pratisalsi]QIB33759.1 malto-oligosyltrehalose synthase [Ancylobacter pratisalsi]